MAGGSWRVVYARLGETKHLVSKRAHGRGERCCRRGDLIGNSGDVIVEERDEHKNDSRLTEPET